MENKDRELKIKYKDRELKVKYKEGIIRKIIKGRSLVKRN